MSDLNQPVVIDNGSGVIKAGFAGADSPKVLFPAYVGRPKHERVMAGGAAEGQQVFVGDKATELRGILRLAYPTDHGVTQNWDDQRLLWQHAFDQLNVVHEEHPVLLTEPPLNPRTNRMRCAEIFFEGFNVPAFYVQMQAALSLYASGRSTGVVLDSGDGVTYAVPIYEGFCLSHAISRTDVGGRDVTHYLATLLRKAMPLSFHTSAELEVVKTIKEKLGYIAYKVDAKDDRKQQDQDLEAEQPYKLPDGQVITVGVERFRAPELLFNPTLIGLEYPGIHQCLVNAISKSDIDIRRRLYSEIVVAGGSTMFDGFGNRLLAEVTRLAPRDIKIKIYTPKDRHLSTWIGGSILAALATFKKMWISRKEYDENGKTAIFRKAF